MFEAGSGCPIHKQCVRGEGFEFPALTPPLGPPPWPGSWIRHSCTSLLTATDQVSLLTTIRTGTTGSYEKPASQQPLFPVDHTTEAESWTPNPSIWEQAGKFSHKVVKKQGHSTEVCPVKHVPNAALRLTTNSTLRQNNHARWESAPRKPLMLLQSPPRKNNLRWHFRIKPFGVGVCCCVPSLTRFHTQEVAGLGRGGWVKRLVKNSKEAFALIFKTNEVKG